MSRQPEICEDLYDCMGIEIDLEKNRVRDEVKNEMVDIARAMAGKIVSDSIDERKQESLITETLEEMGDETWRS